MTTTFRPLLLSAALGAALGLTAPAFAQDAGVDTSADAELVAEATVPADRLADRYVDLAGSEEAATELVGDLRAGNELTWTEEVTTEVTNDDGTTTTNVELVERTVANPNGPMGYGEVNITLSLAQALLESGAYPDLQSALTGISTTTTNADGTTVTVVEGGVLALRADGMGWGQIAQELGFNLGSLVSASNRPARVEAEAGLDTAGQARGSERSAEARAAAQARVDTRTRVERPAVERPVFDRPERPTRPERPERPERGGRPGG